MMFNPFTQDGKTHTSQNVFYLQFKDSSLITSNITTIRLFFMDKTSSPRLYPDDTEMVGDPIAINLALATPRFLTYKTHIFRSQNIESDPSLICVDYTTNNSFYDCIQNELKQFFSKTIGCLPPPLHILYLSQRSQPACSLTFPRGT